MKLALDLPGSILYSGNETIRKGKFYFWEQIQEGTRTKNLACIQIQLK